MTTGRRVLGSAAAIVLLAAAFIWAYHPWMVGGPSPFRAVDDADGLDIMTKVGSVSSTGAIFQLVNETDAEWSFGKDYWIEKKEGDGWRELKSLRSWGVDAIAYLLAPQSVRDEVCAFGERYGHLTSGEYRLVKELMKERSGGYEYHYLTAEFFVR